jgi:P-type E1-E2 ATPase
LVGPQLDALSPEELEHAVAHCNVFARASPDNKIQLIQALLRNGETTAMIGDGVNDA